MKSDLRKYNRKGHAAVTKEFLQLHTPEAFGSLKAEDMTEEQKKDVLEMLMSTKEKRDSTINLRGCADEQKQHEKYNNVDSMSQQSQ